MNEVDEVETKTAESGRCNFVSRASVEGRRVGDGATETGSSQQSRSNACRRPRREPLEGRLVARIASDGVAESAFAGRRGRLGVQDGRDCHGHGHGRPVVLWRDRRSENAKRNRRRHLVGRLRPGLDDGRRAHRVQRRRRGRGGRLSGAGLGRGQGGLMSHEGLERDGDGREHRRGVLARQRQRRLLQIVREAVEEVPVVLDGPGALAHVRPAQDHGGHGQGRAGHDRRQHRHELAVEHGHLGDVQGHVLELGIVLGVGRGHHEEGVDGGMADDPVDRLQQVPLELQEHAVVVGGAAQRPQVVEGRHAVLAVAELGRHEEGGAAQQLVVALEDDPRGAVAVHEIDGEEERLRPEAVGGVGLDEEVQQERTHVPADLGLQVDRSHVRHGDKLPSGKGGRVSVAEHGLGGRTGSGMPGHTSISSRC